MLDVNRALNGLSDFLRRALGEDVSLEIVGGGGVWPVEADAAELEAAILNLAVNARDAMPDGGKLTIEASNSYLDDGYCKQNADVRPGQYVQIAVTDTGSGMAQGRDRARLRAVLHHQTIRPGHRTWAQPSLRFRQAVRRPRQNLQREGRRHRRSRSICRGSSAEPRRRKRSPPRPSRGRSGECVLVVEDDADVRSYVVETLGALGYDVLEAADGEDALRLLDATEACGCF